jgi:hypothetical protein
VEVAIVETESLRPCPRRERDGAELRRLSGFGLRAAIGRATGTTRNP